MKRMLGMVAIAWVFLAAFGCGPQRSRVMVPPQIDLKPHEVIGVVEFNCSSEDEFGPFATGRFIEAMRRDQGMVRVVRLGTESDLLAAVDQSRLDAAAFKALGEKFGVQTIVTGDLVFSDVRPNLSLSQSLTHIGVSADVRATLAVQMVEAASGASLWSRSAEATQRLGAAGFSTNKDVSLHVGDSETAYSQLADRLVYAVTPEFRVTWEYR